MKTAEQVAREALIECGYLWPRFDDEWESALAMKPHERQLAMSTALKSAELALAAVGGLADRG